jgi:hypothetical protein
VKSDLFSRGGSNWVNVASADHDFKLQATLTPFGILLPRYQDLFDQMKKVRRDIAGRDDFILISVCVDTPDDDKKVEAWSQFLLSQGTVDYGDGRRRFIDDSRWWGCTEVGLDEPTSDQYRVNRYPESFLIGADGKLAAVRIPHKNLREAVANALKVAR